MGKKELGYKKGSFRKRWGLLKERLVWIGMLTNSLFRSDTGEFWKIFWDIDGYLAGKEITIESITASEEAEILKERLIEGVITLILSSILFVTISILISIFWVGPITFTKSPKLPYTEPTATSRAYTDIWGAYSFLNQEEAQRLRTQKNVINLALLDGASARYMQNYAVKFDSSNPGVWEQQDQPLGITNLNPPEGTSITFSADGQVYTLNIYEGFVRQKDPSRIYIVDENGQLWTTLFTDELLIPIGNVALPIEVSPNPNLSFTL